VATPTPRPAPAPTPVAAAPLPQPVNCVGAWSACSRTCGGLGQQLYNITTPAANGGRNCEAANASKKDCMTPGCPNETICSNDSECISGYCETSGDNYRCKTRPPPPQQTVEIAGTTYNVPQQQAPPAAQTCDCSMGAQAYRAAGCGRYGEDC
jgi:hypothetical protein